MMKRYVRRALIGLGAILGLCVVLIVTCALAVPLIDWNKARPWLVARIKGATGRDVSINGDLDVAWRMDTTKRVHPWLPRLHIAAADLTIANIPGAKNKTFAAGKSVEFDLLPWALLYHEIAIGSAHAIEPVVHLERSADGKNNWTFSADGAPSHWSLRLGRVAFDAGKFDLDDALDKVHLDVSIEPLPEPIEFGKELQEEEQRATAQGKSATRSAKQIGNKDDEPRTPTSERYRFAWKASGHSASGAVSGSGKIGGLLGFRDDTDPWPVQGEITSGSTHIALIGTLKNPADLSALDLRLWIAGANMADLYPLLRITLPQTKPFATDGRLRGELHVNGNRLAYEDFRGRVGESDVAGTLTYDSRPSRPLLSGKVESNVLQLADLGTLIGATPAESAPDDGGKGGARTLPTRQFHVERWNSMDAAVDFSAKRLMRKADLPISDIHTHVAMDNGVLTLKPLTFAIAGGSADATLDLNGMVNPPNGHFNAAAHQLKLGAMFPGIDAMRASIGEVNGDLALDISGDSVAQLLAASNGELKLVVDSGSVSKAALEGAGLNLANFVLAHLFGDQQVRINCAAADFDVRTGVLQTKLFVIDTDDALIRTDGTISLAEEKIDLIVHPDAKRLRVLSLRSPLRVTGTFRHVDVSVDKRALLARGGGAIALAALAPVAALVPLIATSAGVGGNSCQGVFSQLRAAGSAPRKAH